MSAPSGAGKHSVLQRVMDRDARLVCSISATTRAPREGETDGKEYFFLERGDFEQRIEEGEFLEWAEVHGNLYGTLRSEMQFRLSSGMDVLLELDVQGMKNLKRLESDVVSVFIMPPSMEILEQRLRGRGTNTEDDIALRLRNARAELDACGVYDYWVVNDRLDDAVADMEAIIRAQRCRSKKLGGQWPPAH